MDCIAPSFPIYWNVWFTSPFKPNILAGVAVWRWEDHAVDLEGSAEELQGRSEEKSQQTRQVDQGLAWTGEI